MLKPKTIFSLLFFATFLIVNIALSDASSVTRSFSASSLTIGQQLTVTLNVTITAGEDYYTIDEGIPSNMTIINAGVGNTSQARHIKWAVLDANGTNAIHNYTLTTNTAGTYNFTGTYMFEGMSNEANISGGVSVTYTPLDTTPPTRSNGQPTGNLSSGTTSTTISLTTNENAICRYSITAGTAYSSMNNTFSTTGSTAHSTTVGGLQNGRNYNYYVRCIDAAGNYNTNDFLISFGVNPTGVICIDSDLDGYNITAGCGIADCNDTNPNIYPNATEICGNGIDEDCSGSDLTCPVQPCSLTNAYWSTNSATEGNTVNLIVNGNNCDGQALSFIIWEDDFLIGDDPVNVNPSQAVFSGNQATTTWTAEWQDDFFSDPEYYFIATHTTNSTITINSADYSALLVVSQAAAPPPPTCPSYALDGNKP